MEILKISMKVFFSMFLALTLLLNSGIALSENDLQALLAQKAQLETEMAQLEAEIVRAQEDDIIRCAIEELKRYWTEKYIKYECGNGYLGIRFTRVVYVQDQVNLPAYVPEAKKVYFDNVICFVEFMLLTDYFGTAPYYHDVGQSDWVAFYRDGTFKVTTDVLNLYRSQTYSTDYSGIIASITDRGAAFNADYMLLENQSQPHIDR